MKISKWIHRVGLFVCAIWLTTFGVAAQAQVSDLRATGSEIVIQSVFGSSSCAGLSIMTFVRTAEPMYLVATVIYEGQIVSDIVVSANYPAGVIGFISAGYENDRGRAPVNVWPLTPGKKIRWFLTLFTADWQPVYETRAVQNSCDTTTLVSITHGPAYQLIENHDFEVQGFPGGVPDPFAAIFWKRQNAANDSRVCSPPTPRGGSSNYTGDCGFLFIADAGVTTKVKQKYSGTIGRAGDIAYLNGFAQSFTGYSGGGKVKAVLTFADGTSNTLVRTFASGQSLYGAFPLAYPYEAYFTMPAPLVSATVIIMQKSGTGNIAVDDVTLSVFTNTNTPLRALPAPSVSKTILDLRGG